MRSRDRLRVNPGPSPWLANARDVREATEARTGRVGRCWCGRRARPYATSPKLRRVLELPGLSDTVVTRLAEGQATSRPRREKPASRKRRIDVDVQLADAQAKSGVSGLHEPRADRVDTLRLRDETISL